MWSAIFGLLARLLPMLFGRKAANMAEVADSNARAQEQRNAMEARDEIAEAAARAAASADADMLRQSNRANTVDPGDDNPLNHDRDIPLRD